MSVNSTGNKRTAFGNSHERAKTLHCEHVPCSEAIVLYEYSCPNPDYKSLFEECWSIVDADSEEHARQKVETMAQQNEDSYQNQYGETITVKVKNIVDIAPLLYLNKSIEDGTDLYARFFRNYQAYNQFEPLLGGEAL